MIMDNKQQIESQPEVVQVAGVLAELEEKGLKQVCIASGWTRGWLIDSARSDIDIAYVGDIHYTQAQRLLLEAIQKHKVEHLDWDLEGIWNAELACPEITTTRQHYLVHYVCSIDSVYLASDGKLHDATGFGFEDAANKVLRMNDFEQIDFNYQPVNIVYLCLEGCRRIAKFGWTPTSRSVELIRKGLPLWSELSAAEREYFYTKKIVKKFPPEDWQGLKSVYDQLGWGFIFEESKPFILK